MIKPGIKNQSCNLFKRSKFLNISLDFTRKPKILMTIVKRNSIIYMYKDIDLDYSNLIPYNNFS